MRLLACWCNSLAFSGGNEQQNDLCGVCFPRPAARLERSSPSPYNIAHHTTIHTHNVPMLLLYLAQDQNHNTKPQISTPPLSTVSDGISHFRPQSASMAVYNFSPPLLQACLDESIRRQIIFHLSNHDPLQPSQNLLRRHQSRAMAVSRVQNPFPTSNKTPLIIDHVQLTGRLRRPALGEKVGE